MAFIRRLTIDVRAIEKNPPPLYYAASEDSSKNMFYWIGRIEGPNDTPHDS
ncbi:unnamed protein product, partial [Rotaria sp. Silwood1]